MVLLMMVAAVVSVVQLAALGSWGRSLRVTTLLQAIAVGFYACGTVTVLLQFAWTHAVAGLTGTSLRDVVATAAYTSTLSSRRWSNLPLAALAWRWRATHRQLGLVDHLLAGAALGAGFELFEAALRYSTLGALVARVPDGYLVAAGLGGSITVPSIGTSLTSWEPVPAAFGDLFVSGGDTVQHLVWTALAGLGLGWFVRPRGAIRWLGWSGLVVAVLDHANYNLRTGDVPRALSWPSDALSWVGGQLSTLLVVLVLVAVALDRRALTRSRAEHPDVLLAGEAPTGLAPGPLVHVAGLGFPWSTYTTWRFVLARRAVLFADAVGGPSPLGPVRRDRDLLARARSGPAWRAAGRRLARSVGAAAAPRRFFTPATVVWLAASVPAVLYLVVGALPATSGLQRAMRGPVGLWALVLAALASSVALALQLRPLVGALRSVPATSLHEVRVRLQERLVAMSGALVAVVPLLIVALMTRDANRYVVENHHALEALGTALLILGLALFIAAFFLFPPFGLAMTTAGTLALVSTLTPAFGVMVGGSVVLSGLGVLLSEAAGDGSSSSGESSGSTGGSSDVARRQRIEELAMDPANGGKITPSSRAEAEVGAGLEERGAVEGLRRSPNPAEEFIDGQGRPWDVKAFHSEHGRFDLEVSMRKITQEMTWSKENVMLDTRNLSPTDLARLREAVEAATARGELPLRVLWWP
jgi:hypothetical protein